MASHKEYAVATTNLSRTRATATEIGSSTPAFEFQFSFAIKDLVSSKNHSLVMRQSSQVIGLCDIELMASTIYICFGDADASPNSVVWESLGRSDEAGQSAFELSVELGGARRVFDWKRTHDVEGVRAATKKADWLNFKMVDRESGRVVARFVHHPWYGKKRGVFEIERGVGGSEWEKVVLLSGMALVEYKRKVSGWSW